MTRAELDAEQALDLIINPEDHDNFTEYSMTYFTTTENITGYFDLLDWSNSDKILTVCGSGDQVLNAILYGSTIIDTFDSNKLAEYILDYKIAAIKSFNFQEFKYFIYCIMNNLYAEELFNYKILRRFLTEKGKMFWDIMYEKYSNVNVIYDGNLFQNICFQSTNKYKNKRNKYINNEYYYDLLRKKIWNIILKFYNLNLLDLPNNCDKDYSKVFLSNISDYLYMIYENNYLVNFKTFIEKDLSKNIRVDGEIIASYLYANSQLGNSTKSKEDREKVFGSMFIEERFESVYSDKKYNTDSILIYRKR